MKILIVSPYFYPAKDYGGPPEQIYNTAKVLSKKNRLTVFTSNTYTRKKNLSKKTVIKDYNKNLKVYYFNATVKIGNIYFTPKILKEKRIIQEQDIIILNELRTFQNIFTFLIAKKKRLIIIPRGTIPYYKQREILKKIFDKLIGNRILKKIELIIAASEREKKELEKYNKKIAVIPNVILNKKEKTKNITSKKIIYLGRLHDKKGIDYLIKAVKNANVKLLICGPDDGYEKILREMVKKEKMDKKVEFKGAIYGKEKIKLIKESDMLVLPSFFESFGNAAIEAVSCGKPVIITDKCGVKDFIENNNFGITVKIKDSDDIERAIKMIYEKYDTYKKRVEQFDVKEYNKEIERLYEQLMEDIEQCAE